jgi:NAD dependent epimerase/dehydratase family enzyme
MKIAIVSGNGFVGSALAKEFEQNGHIVSKLTRKDSIQSDEVLISKLEVDIVINLAGASIIGNWTEKYKKLLRSSRIDLTHRLVELFTKMQNRPKLVISTSAGSILFRPTIFPVPEFILKIIFGEGAKVLTDGQKVIPERLIENGFKSKFDNINSAIKDLVL